MALVPHKVVALNELNEGGKNTIAGAVVSLFDTEGNAVTLFDDESGANGSTAKQTDSEGVVVVYVTPGEYDEQVNGGIQRRVLIGNKEIATEQLIERIRKTREGDVITTTGFYEAGDSGGAQWKATGTTGLTPSQTPADRGAAELVDGSGRLWALVSIAGTSKREVNPLWLGCIPGSDSTQAMQAAFNSAVGGVLVGAPSTFLISSTVIINGGMTVQGNGMELKADPSKPLTVNMLKTFNGDAPTRAVSGLKIFNLMLDGANLSPQRWLQNPTNGAAITDPESDYEAGGIIAEGGDIFDVIAADRRNPNYTQTTELMELTCTENTTIEGCTFRNHFGRAITEGGGKNVTIRANNFINIGKDDGPYHAIWTQSFGNPNSPTASFLDSENIIIEGNYAQNLERGFVIFNPTKGGTLRNNTIKGWGESCVFCNTFLNMNGSGVIDMTGNNFINGVITDIVCQAFEVNGLENINISRNYVFSSDGEAFGVVGCIDTDVKGNRTYNVYKNHTIPYGPFSERYAFAVGSAPIAGNSASVSDGSVYAIGTFDGVGCESLTISGNTIKEDRASYPSVLRQYKSGGDNLAGSCYVFGNTLKAPAGMEMLNTTTGNVWQLGIPIEIGNNKGHVSNEVVPHLKQWAANATGQYTVDVGFRPRYVSVIASSNNASLGRQSSGGFSWNSEGVRNDNNISFSVGASQISALNQTDVITLKNDSNVVTFRAEFVAWTEKGFTVNVITADDALNAVFYCHP